MAHHEHFKALGPLDWGEVSDMPDSQVCEHFEDILANAQSIINSIPESPPSANAVPQRHNSGRARSQTESALGPRTNVDLASGSSAVTEGQLRKEWKGIKINARDNPLDISVYKLAAKDGKGTWFSRRSLHEGIPFEKWKLGMEREFGETLVAGGAQVVEPVAGNVRGIGAERRVCSKTVGGTKEVDVYQMSVQFPGPTTPRDFIACLLSADSHAAPSGRDRKSRAPRQFAIVSKPCIHPDCPPRPGFIRGQYQSVEIIREVPLERPMRRVRSSVDMGRQDLKGLLNGSEIAGEGSLPRSAPRSSTDLAGAAARSALFAPDDSPFRKNTFEADDAEEPRMAVEWLMVTRSDPGGSVPRFMVEKGTPGGIVNDAGRFFNWVSCKTFDDSASSDVHDVKVATIPAHGDAAEGSRFDSTAQAKTSLASERKILGAAASGDSAPSGFYNMIAGAIGAGASAVANHLPAFPTHVSEEEEEEDEDEDDRRSVTSSEVSFASAEEGSPSSLTTPTVSKSEDTEAALSMRSVVSDESQAPSTTPTQHEKELKKLLDRQRRVQEKLEKSIERAAAKKREDTDKDATALAKLHEKHERERARQEEKYQRERKKMEERKAQEEEKAEKRRKKALEREEKANVQLELQRVKSERDVALKEIDVLKDNVSELETQNAALVAQVGRLGGLGKSDSFLPLKHEEKTTERAVASALELQ